MEKQIEIIKSIKAGDLVEDKHLSCSEPYIRFLDNLKFYFFARLPPSEKQSIKGIFTGFAHYKESAKYDFQSAEEVEKIQEDFYSGNWHCYHEVLTTNQKFIYLRFRGKDSKIVI